MNKKTVYPYIPNSVPEIQEEMLKFVGASDAEQLYEEIPEALRFRAPLNLPAPILDEQGIKRHTEKILGKNMDCDSYDNFMGAGCPQHYVPAICDEITSRGELLTAYTSECPTDRGKHQIFFEYQSMMAELLDMDFLTFPCYCGGQATATALRMSSRLNGRNKVLLSKTMNPQNLKIAANYLKSAQKNKAYSYADKQVYQISVFRLCRWRGCEIRSRRNDRCRLWDFRTQIG